MRTHFVRTEERFVGLAVSVFPANPMGRAGMEPATLGLKVDAGLFCWFGNTGRTAWLSQIGSDLFGSSGAALLTFC